MSEGLNAVYQAIDDQNAAESASTRRQVVAAAAATVGGLGLLGLPEVADAHRVPPGDDPQTILNVAATAEVLATILNTLGYERFDFSGLPGDPSGGVTRRNIAAAAREELIHFNVLRGVGAREATRRIWVPDAVFASPATFLTGVEAGDQIFINAYLIATTRFGAIGDGRLARITAEFMGAEAVHRALARQSLGKLGNDRVFMKASRREEARDAPTFGRPGFGRIAGAVAQVQATGIGLGRRGRTPGAFYDFNSISRRTPNPPDVNTRVPD